ncbi:hypothetical protein MLD38_012640 [Melastoma candidum]|uniref:Uncharacterized protein n=1 Tax=Melastoma candidum TaxID=119954 RepID=A0ACB9RB64_9MYRT|nr:hypothetical protein MLD38_012640 [Melastoma candidum]
MMSRFSKALVFHRHQNPNSDFIHLPCSRLLSQLIPEQYPSSALPRTRSTSSKWDLKDSASESDSDGLDQSKPNKPPRKPLHLFFKESLGLVPKNVEEEGGDVVQGEGKGNELSQRLRELQRRLRQLKVPEKVLIRESQAGRVKREDEGSEEEPIGSDGVKVGSFFKACEIKEVSPGMEMFLDHLFRKDYFRDANFFRTRNGKVDMRCFEDSYSREYLKHVAKEFGKDHQDISKWLSGSDLKTLAMFGCPSVARGTVLAAKSLRCFFDIPENNVCSKCILKDSCKFVNKGLHDGGSKHLRLPDAMRVIILYALEWVDSPLEVPQEIKGCVSRLLRDIVKLSENTKSSAARNI